MNTILKVEIPIWNNAIDQFRPYLSLSDAIKVIHFIVAKNIFNQQTYNILTGNYTVRYDLTSEFHHEGDRKTFRGKDDYARHDTGVDYSCPSDPSRTSDENCDDLTVPTVPTSATAVANTDRTEDEVQEAKDSLGD